MLSKEYRQWPNRLLVEDIKQDNCFDFLRYLFAIAVIIAHFCILTDTEQPSLINGSNCLKALLASSGFLVTYSFLRRNGDIISYAKRRFIRIIPAYIACVVFCFLLGLTVSTLNVSDFLADKQTWKYLGSNFVMCNWIEPELPDTFQGNYMPQMNGSLWTMKLEVLFYVLLPFILYAIKKTDKIYALLLLGCLIAVYNIVPVQIQYFTFFISGMTLLLYFDAIKPHIKWLLTASTILVLANKFIPISAVNSICYSIEPITFPVMAVSFAYWCKPLFCFSKFNNITYGLYLYHFPIIQTLSLLGVVNYSKTLSFVLTIVITTILACGSWFIIEKPLLKRH